MQLFLEYLFAGISNGAIYAALALALVMVFRGTGTINFAQGEMALFTTYIAWGLTTKNVPVILCLLIATAAGFVLGAVTERVLIRPIERRGLLATLIVLLGLFLALNSLDGVLWGNQNYSMPSLFPNSVSSFVTLGGARLYWANLGLWIVVAVLVGAMFQLFNHTRLGLHMRATASNRESASLSGIPVGRILLLGWGFSAAIGAIAGVLLTPLSPDSLGVGEMFPILIQASAAALFGGLDSPGGAVMAGLLMGVVEALLSGYVPAIGGQLQEAIAFVAIVLVLLVRPQGLFGSKEVERV
ncbi:MAG: branched-chain amino acid ABC transporter permease [Acidimicrobiales bacterium]